MTLRLWRRGKTRDNYDSKPLPCACSGSWLPLACAKTMQSSTPCACRCHAEIWDVARWLLKALRSAEPPERSMEQPHWPKDGGP